MKNLTFTQVMWAHIHEMPVGPRCRGMPGEPSTYGFVAADEDQWREVYYVGISESATKPVGCRDIGYGLFYPERLFLWGEDDDGNDMGFGELLDTLKKARFYGDEGYWEPCLVWRGFAPGLKPTFRRALRADANLGPTMHNLRSGLKSKAYGWADQVREEQVDTSVPFRTGVWLVDQVSSGG